VIDNENAIKLTYNRGFTWLANGKKTYSDYKGLTDVAMATMLC